MSENPPAAGSRYDAHADAPDHDVRGVLAIGPFRRLWMSLGLSSFGDWLGLLATTALAKNLGGESSYAAANLAVAGVLVLRLAPAIVFGPLAGALADRFDRKVTMVVGDLLRAGLFVTIPLVGTLWWLFVATVLIEIVGLFWMPAKDATVPNLVPRRRLEAANQLSLATTYGSAPFAALLFSGLALLSGAMDDVVGFLGGPIDLALYANAATYLVAAVVVSRLEMPRRAGQGTDAPAAPPGVWRTILDGWAYVGSTRLVRGLVIGMLGAFGAGGFVIGVAPTFVDDLGAGEPGYGVLFAAVFAGLAGGMWVGPRLLAELPRWRLFSVAIVVAGCFLALVALIPNIVLAAMFTALLGAAAGVAWVTGYTMLGLEVADELRGRTFAFVQSASRVVLVGVMALAPALAALFGTHTLQFTPTVSLDYNGAALTLMVAAVLAAAIGVVSYRQMNEGSPVSLREDVLRAWTRRHVAQPAARAHGTAGVLVALEGGDGAGKSTQARMLRGWLRERGHEVVLTREPGATPLGERLREVLLHGDAVDARAEALLFAADRAQHVADVVRPALRRGAVVVTDRYTDSSIAYQGAGRDLDADEVASLSRWATGDLVPDVTVVLDVDPGTGRDRTAGRGAADRLETEELDFHGRVRERFLELSAREPRRYLVVDATGDAAEVQRRIRERLVPMLPGSAEPAEPERQETRRPDAGRRDAEGPAAEGPDAEGRDAEGRDAEGRDAEGRDAEGRDAEGRDAEGRDAEGRDAEGPDAEGRDAEVQRAEAEARRTREAERRAEQRAADAARREQEAAQRRERNEERRIEAERHRAEQSRQRRERELQRRADEAARRERDAAEARRVEQEQARQRRERAAADARRREAEVAAHAEEVRRRAGGDDGTQTASLPVVGPGTAPIDLGEEVFQLGGPRGRSEDDHGERGEDRR